MSEMYECGTCGTMTKERNHLCNPQPLSESGACHMKSEKSQQMCEPIQENVQYQCGSCGRPTEDAGNVCKPEKYSP